MHPHVLACLVTMNWLLSSPEHASHHHTLCDVVVCVCCGLDNTWRGFFPQNVRFGAATCCLPQTKAGTTPHPLHQIHLFPTHCIIHMIQYHTHICMHVCWSHTCTHVHSRYHIDIDHIHYSKLLSLKSWPMRLIQQISKIQYARAYAHTCIMHVISHVWACAWHALPPSTFCLLSLSCPACLALVWSL